MNEKQFVETYCHNCGTQRCEGIGTEWFEGCKYKWGLDGMEIEATSEINRLEQQCLALATKIIRLQEQISKEGVKHGYWKCKYNEELGETEVTCSVCGDSRDINGCFVSIHDEPLYDEDAYCPRCGAKMDGGNAE